MKRMNWNKDWVFTKDCISLSEKNPSPDTAEWEHLDLPHTWNGTDGQDGGNDYYRGTCWYVKHLERSELPEGNEFYLEFEGANSSADLYVNGKQAAHHDGGYSTWRVNITKLLQTDNVIAVAVDNSPNEQVYPQSADFTFYGGIYRNVNLLSVNRVHFDLDYFGGPGIAVTPKINGTNAELEVCAYVTGAQKTEKIYFSVYDETGTKAETCTDINGDSVQSVMKITDVRLWNGKKDPHLYTLKAVLKDEETVLDEREIRFGCRTFEIDPNRGFILNGEEYPLRGVARHQDRPVKGNALSREDQEEDMALIMEMGATTVRLAHYQHDQYFYDLCDENGLIVWAEIPYISRHMPEGRENTVSQMKELITQNYHHPSIVVWGLSNEINLYGEDSADLVGNHKILNDLAHEMDPTRKTTVAVLSTCSIDHEYLRIPDVLSYNLYYGWYGGEPSMNGEFLDHFHEKYPDTPIGLSEYGCEALDWHTSHPEQGDYTEEYQAYFHEELIRQLFSRPFVWATHVWNMFDFGADARAEGGEEGMNHKGLVSFDRKYKKDAFYAYKAWLSDEPFVHICGKRYVDRVEEVTKITVYSNQPEVELSVNGKTLGSKRAEDHFFYFDVPNEGESVITVKAGNCTDESRIRKVDTFNKKYTMEETGEVLNWFEITTPEGYFSINDKVGDIMATEEGKKYLLSFKDKPMAKIPATEGRDEVVVDLTEDILKVIPAFTLKRILNMVAKSCGNPFAKEDLLEVNRELNQIRKE